jgi:hypothetical protein
MRAVMSRHLATAQALASTRQEQTGYKRETLLGPADTHSGGPSRPQCYPAEPLEED